MAPVKAVCSQGNATAVMVGSISLQRSITNGQRGWKRQPDGGLIGEGTSPGRIISSRTTSGCAGSAAEKSALV